MLLGTSRPSRSGCWVPQGPHSASPQFRLVEGVPSTQNHDVAVERPAVLRPPIHTRSDPMVLNTVDSKSGWDTAGFPATIVEVIRWTPGAMAAALALASSQVASVGRNRKHECLPSCTSTSFHTCHASSAVGHVALP